jgi:hypothetical protein
MYARMKRQFMNKFDHTNISNDLELEELLDLGDGEIQNK